MPVELNALRQHLVDQVREQGAATDPIVLDALRTVPRHLFLPDLPPEQAYRDEAIVTKRDEGGRPISSSSQPTIMAIMLDQLAVRRGQRVLEIGAGTGFNAALLAHMVGEQGRVTSVDLDEDTVERARENLDAAGCQDVVLVTGDGSLGHADGAPYDRIIATVGVWDLAPAWRDQLAPGGRLVVPLDLRGVQRTVAFEVDGDHWTSLSAQPCGFMRMRGPFAGPERSFLVGETVTLSLPEDRDVDAAALADVLAEAPAVAGTGTAPSANDLFDGFSLWLAVREPRWCSLSEVAGADSPLLRAAPLTAPESRVTAGILGDDGVALLSRTDGELTVLGYGNEAVANDLLVHVRAWESAGRPGTGSLRVDAYPAGVSVPDGGTVLEKGECRLILTW
ncbi:methyltransferase, FxLD system [Actinophytocola oryzae]|uniref:Protein-L-isoaspartate O-methyltransferase n=1 Tax=Actinophytocola oryzae TaxID=502181 RepID=A0A4R7VRV7_9PSEU|nr:methyltransferase, FxLD system [Actinophytocola oryzae]TDV51957.1 protein-L-isoaspartate(D-aspartate) O-methyltransferase [Actinophytocola oryzae]